MLEDERMVDAVRLAASGADLDIVRETGLMEGTSLAHIHDVDRHELAYADIRLTLIAACRARAISLSCSRRGLLPRISGSQNWPTAPFICPILPWAGAGALTHCDGSRPTPQTM